MKGFITIVAVLFASSLLFCQESEFLRGKLLDAQTQEPIPFATLRIKGKSLGVITNEDGGFRFPMEYRIEGDTILISSMGYLKREIPLLNLSSSNINLVRLSPGIFQLDDVVLKSDRKKKKPSAAQIVQYAIENIPRNYPKNKFSLVGYYRDYQEKKGEYVNLNEAIVEIRDGGFMEANNFRADFLLYSRQKNEDFTVDPFMAKPYDYKTGDKVIPSATMFNSGGNELFTLIIHDAIRNYKEESFSFIDKMETDFVTNHKFHLIRTTVCNTQAVYEIGIRYRKNGYLGKGKIYIGKENYAIHKLDYSLFIYRLMTPSGSDRASSNGAHFKEEDSDAGLVYQVTTEYLPGEDQKMYLNYISFRNKFILRRPPIFSTAKFAIDLNDTCFKVTLNRKPHKLEKLKPKDFVFNYKGKHLPIEKFHFVEDSLRFWIYPDKSVKSLRTEMKELFTETESMQISHFQYAFNGIKDSLGNVLDERQSEHLEQYREFFVQEVQDFPYADTKETVFMRKNAPIFSPLQPVYLRNRLDRYWMNTPLQEKLP
ncbi:MAG: carboxypeptidase-like regulatory domain-containing protein [Flavobacteriaceae bacterium]